MAKYRIIENNPGSYLGQMEEALAWYDPPRKEWRPVTKVSSSPAVIEQRIAEHAEGLQKL